MNLVKVTGVEGSSNVTVEIYKIAIKESNKEVPNVAAKLMERLRELERWEAALVIDRLDKLENRRRLLGYQKGPVVVQSVTPTSAALQVPLLVAVLVVGAGGAGCC